MGVKSMFGEKRGLRRRLYGVLKWRGKGGLSERRRVLMKILTRTGAGQRVTLDAMSRKKG